MIENIINKFVDYIVGNSNLYLYFDDYDNEVVIEESSNIDKDDKLLKMYPYMKRNPDYINDFKDFLIKRTQLYNSNKKFNLQNNLLYIINIVMYIDSEKDFDYDYIPDEYKKFYFILSLFGEVFEDDSNASSKILKLKNKVAKIEFMEFRKIIDEKEKVYKTKSQKNIPIKVDFRHYLYDLIQPINILDFLMNNFSPFTDEQNKSLDLTYLISLLNKPQKLALLNHILNEDKYDSSNFYLTEKTKEYLIDKYFKTEFVKLTLKSFK